MYYIHAPCSAVDEEVEFPDQGHVTLLVYHYQFTLLICVMQHFRVKVFPVSVFIFFGNLCFDTVCCCMKHSLFCRIIVGFFLFIIQEIQERVTVLTYFTHFVLLIWGT